MNGERTNEVCLESVVEMSWVFAKTSFNDFFPQPVLFVFFSWVCCRYLITQRHLHDSRCVKVKNGVRLFNVVSLFLSFSFLPFSSCFLPPLFFFLGWPGPFSFCFSFSYKNTCVSICTGIEYVCVYMYSHSVYPSAWKLSPVEERRYRVCRLWCTYTAACLVSQ